jgi:hypothetical protein
MTAVNLAPTPDGVRANADFLFESVVCDLHLTALSVGALAMLLQARAAAGASWTLKGWRPLLDDDRHAMRLTLRFHADMGMPAAMAARIADLYARLAEAKTTSAEFAKLSSKHATLDSVALARAAEGWRRLCRETVGALEAIAPAAKQRLPSPYDEDCRTLVAFLVEAAEGKLRRVGAFGEITLPQLRQRRRSPRAAVRRSCALLLPDGRVSAEIEDASRNGLGILCRRPLHEGQQMTVELADGRRLSAVVARRNGDQTGLRLLTPLAADDPLFRRDVVAGAR